MNSDLYEEGEVALRAAVDGTGARVVVQDDPVDDGSWPVDIMRGGRRITGFAYCQEPNCTNGSETPGWYECDDEGCWGPDPLTPEQMAEQVEAALDADGGEEPNYRPTMILYRPTGITLVSVRPAGRWHGRYHHEDRAIHDYRSRAEYDADGIVGAGEPVEEGEVVPEGPEWVREVYADEGLDYHREYMQPVETDGN